MQDPDAKDWINPLAVILNELSLGLVAIALTITLYYLPSYLLAWITTTTAALGIASTCYCLSTLGIKETYLYLQDTIANIPDYFKRMYCLYYPGTGLVR